MAASDVVIDVEPTVLEEGKSPKPKAKKAKTERKLTPEEMLAKSVRNRAITSWIGSTVGGLAVLAGLLLWFLGFEVLAVMAFFVALLVFSVDWVYETITLGPMLTGGNGAKKKLDDKIDSLAKTVEKLADEVKSLRGE